MLRLYIDYFLRRGNLLRKILLSFLVSGLILFQFSSITSANNDVGNLDKYSEEVIESINEVLDYAERSHDEGSLNEGRLDNEIVKPFDLMSAKSVKKDAYVKGKYGAARAYIWIENFFMSPDAAYKYSLKLDTSAKESVGYLVAGFIPGIGPMISIAGTLGSINRGKSATEIRNLTQKGKAVQIIYMSPGVGSGGTGYVVKEWKRTSYPVYKGANPSFWQETYRKYK